MPDTKIGFYIKELCELVKICSLDQFIELYNRTFPEETPLAARGFLGNLKEQNLKGEFLDRIGLYEKEEIKRICNAADQILSRRKQS